MKRSTNAVSLPIALAVAFASSAALADRIKVDDIYAELPLEIAQDGQKFMNPPGTDQDSQLHHRVNEQSPDQAKKERKQLQVQQNKKAKHQFQYKEKGSGPHQNQSGSFGAFSGKSSGGGGRGR